jgi:hypothetical protein
MRRSVISVALTLLVALGMSPPASAINDPVAPGDNCSASSAAIGHPGGVPATERAEMNGADNPVDGVASRSNPGNAVTENDTSADASMHEQASERCPNG